MKKAKITAEGNFSQPSLKYHSFAKVFLVSLIIHLMWEERQDFEINIVFDVLFYERKDCPLKGDSKASSIGCTELTPFLGRILIKVGRNTLTPITS